MDKRSEQPRGAKGEARRRQIIMVAGSLFGRRSFDSVTLRDIAAEAEITHPLLLHYFSTKNDLLRAVIDSWRDRADSLGLITNDELESYPARVIALANENLATPGYIALFTTLVTSAVNPKHPAHHEVLDRYDATVDVVTDYFLREAEHGRLRPGLDPEIVARGLIAIEDGAQIQWLFSPQKVDIPEIVRMYFRLVLVNPFGESDIATPPGPSL